MFLLLDMVAPCSFVFRSECAGSQRGSHRGEFGCPCSAITQEYSNEQLPKHASITSTAKVNMKLVRSV